MERNSGKQATLRALSCAALSAMAGVGLFVAAGVVSAASWNARLIKVETFRAVSAPGGGVWLHEDFASDVFYGDEIIDVKCHFDFTKYSAPSDVPPVTFAFLTAAVSGANSKVVGTEVVDVAGKAFNPVNWWAWKAIAAKSLGTGKVQIGCRIDSKDDNLADNQPKYRVVTVLPAQPGGVGVLPAPAPEFVSPADGAKYGLGPSLSLSIRVRVPQSPFGYAKNFLDYVKESPNVERWHLEIVRTGQGQLKGFETKVGEFEGALNQVEFGPTALTHEWFVKNGGPGRYASRAWFSQDVTMTGSGGQKIVKKLIGPNSRVEFEIVAPVVLDASAAAPGQAMPAPGAIQGGATAAAARSGIGGESPRGATTPLTRGTLPAVQSPVRGSGTAPGGTVPNWGGLGERSGSPPSSVSPPAVAGEAGQLTLDPVTERALSVAACTRSPGISGLRFSCASRAGLDRCETLRRQGKVEHCALAQGR